MYCTAFTLYDFSSYSDHSSLYTTGYNQTFINTAHNTAQEEQGIKPLTLQLVDASLYLHSRKRHRIKIDKLIRQSHFLSELMGVSLYSTNWFIHVPSQVCHLSVTA